MQAAASFSAMAAVRGKGDFISTPSVPVGLLGSCCHMHWKVPYHMASRKSNLKWKVQYKMASTLSSAQCRAARALLGWTQKDIATRSHVNLKTIADLERSARTPFPRTLKDIVEAFEAAGILFLEPEEGVGGQGVRLAWGMEPALRQGGEDESEAGGRSGRGNLSLPDDPELCGLYDYWRERPNEWQELSDPVRRAVLSEIFGGTPEGDPISETLDGL